MSPSALHQAWGCSRHVFDTSLGADQDRPAGAMKSKIGKAAAQFRTIETKTVTNPEFHQSECTAGLNPRYTFPAFITADHLFQGQQTLSHTINIQKPWQQLAHYKTKLTGTKRPGAP